jgi:5'-nucleotidase
MLVLVDMDGVLADFEGEFLRRWRKKFPRQIFYPLDKRDTFYVHEQYGKEMQDKVREITGAPGFFASLPLIADGDLALHTLLSLGHKVIICTSPLSSNPTCLQEKYDWVNRYLGKDLARSMIIIKDKTMVMGDILIDDRPEVVGAFKPTWEHVLFHAPYNKAVANKKRLHHWGNIHLLLAELQMSVI